MFGYIFLFQNTLIRMKGTSFVHIVKIFSPWCTTGRSDFFYVQKWSKSACTMFGYFFISEHANSLLRTGPFWRSDTFWRADLFCRSGPFCRSYFSNSKSGQEVILHCLVIFFVSDHANSFLRTGPFWRSGIFWRAGPFWRAVPFCRSDFCRSNFSVSKSDQKVPVQYLVTFSFQNMRIHFWGLANFGGLAQFVGLAHFADLVHFGSPIFPTPKVIRNDFTLFGYFFVSEHANSFLMTAPFLRSGPFWRVGPFCRSDYL